MSRNKFNPIILGLLTSGICYTYLKWNEYQLKINNPDDIVESPSMKYSIIFGILVFLLLSIWNNYNKSVTVKNVQVKIPFDIATSSPPVPAFKSLGDALPHVFLETMK